MSIAEKPFLFMPFGKQNYHITEGWKYSEQESSIHGFSGHGAVDFGLPRGTEVLAAADGIAIASYYCRLVKDKETGEQKLHQGKPVGMGLGYFVQIYHPQAKLFTAYGHLERVHPEIPFHKPIKRNGNFWPVGHMISPQDLSSYHFAVEVKRGQVIGYVGDSGLILGYDDYPNRPDPIEFPSWDEVHLHFEVFKRVGSRKMKKYFDPFGIKGDFNDYPDSFKEGEPLGEKTPVLWVLNQNSTLQFA